MLNLYILQDHVPVVTQDFRYWGWWCQGPGNEERRRVAWDEIGEIEVSTVFLGVDTGICRPELFETMIFGGACHNAQWRWATWDEAVQGHALAVRLATTSALSGQNGHAEQGVQSREDSDGEAGQES